MSHAALSIAVFSVYLLLNGFAFLVMPNRVLPVMGLPPTDEPWIRGLGIVITVMGFYHAVAARTELTPFFRATLLGRAFVLTSLGALSLVGAVPPQLLLFGVTDIAFAAWTFASLRSDSRARPVAP